ncbi:hypothetical protein Bca4012_007400 [Brassica carinata]|uniref:(rape) hypothetical protein n=1 Tax=Brassica napus TaxID=3708 RepID=A0A816IK94_BRANA|nr:unnamed protein product [Brassica napus]
MLESLCPLLQLLQISNEEAVAKHLKLEMSIAASASARVNPFSESTQYFDWLNLEKTYRELSPAEQQYFVSSLLLILTLL